MKPSDKTCLKHIIEKINDIESSTAKISEKDFKEDKDIVDAIIRRLEVIGEAAKNISIKTKKEHPEIEWKQIAGLP
jgi:uncharacterized protein with HEPN domain